MFPKIVYPFFHPDQAYVEGQIVALTPGMADRGIRDAWWNHEDLKADFGHPPPIDRHWNWNEMSIDYDGVELPSLKVALVANSNIEGAAMISTMPVPSRLDPSEQGLFLELFFTAPWYRKKLRRDGNPYMVGIGTELLTFAAWLSRKKGYQGRLLLDSSPDEVVWYADPKRGLQKLAKNPILYEGVQYTPMELSAPAAQLLLDDWE
ncbi:MAG: hypothetical protein JWN40_3518 [Phycisphaerales bacterium]|nr:hypothetical protein [Phycisphaerales bacterium]